MSNLFDKLSEVSDQKTLAKFVRGLADDLVKNPEAWENNDLETFLRAMSSWVEDMDGYYKNTGGSFEEKDVSWKNIADMLSAATMYE